MIKRIGILTSGGDAPGMNACIRSVVRTAYKKNIYVTGIEYGFKGLLNSKFINLSPESVTNIVHKGGTILKTNRCEEFKQKKYRKVAYNNLIKENIDGLIILGGDGSFKGASIFSKEYKIPIIGIPSTIDNDIYGTDYSIGFNTAVQTIMDSVDKIRDTASSHERIFFIEVMGRNSGHLSIHAGNATGAELIMIPEIKIKNLGFLVKKIKEINIKKKSIIIIYAEGCNLGPIDKITEYVQKRMKNSNVRFSILGHIQRGGSPCEKDRINSSLFGYYSVNEIIKKGKSKMIGITNDKITFLDLEKSIKTKKEIDKDLFKITEIINNY
tara:strand:+ start:1003 stop:1980 length:978 start_codon:yes stop_codon:yes gene_type:complete